MGEDLGVSKNLKGIQLILGSNDILFKAADMNSIGAAYKKLKEKLFVVENPDRKDNFRVDKAAYTKLMLEFLTRVN